MTVCQIEERDAGRSYPRTCPTCRLSGVCHRGLDRVSLKAERDRLRAEIATLREVNAQQARQIAALTEDREYET